MLVDSVSLGNNLEDIMAKTISFIEDSTQDVFAIAESSREELNNIKNELLLIQQEIDEVIDKLDSKEKENKEARQRLMEVSQQFERYSEREIKKVYELAEDTSVEIAVLREKGGTITAEKKRIRRTI